MRLATKISQDKTDFFYSYYLDNVWSKIKTVSLFDQDLYEKMEQE